MTLQLKQRVGYILLAIWMVVIFLFSAQDARVSQMQSSGIVQLLATILSGAPEVVLSFITRKAAHIFLYFVLGILAYNAMRGYDISGKRLVLASIAIALGYAVLDETHQLFIPGRSGELRDILIDTVAASLGTVAYYGIDRLYKLRKM